MTRRWRRPSGSPGAGAISTSFLGGVAGCLQSRSPRVADRPRAVADDLHLDVPGARQKLFHVHVAAAERRPRLGLAARVGLLQLIAAPHQSHAAPAAAADGLDQHGAGGGQGVEEIGGRGQAGGAGSAGQDGYTEALRHLARFRLVAEQRQQTQASAPQR